MSAHPRQGRESRGGNVGFRTDSDRKATSLPLEARVDLVFGALADPTRRHLIEALAARPGATATGLAASLPISRQAVAKHLKLLGEAGLVNSHREGREALFELDPEPLSEAVAWIGAVGAEWDDRLSDLKSLFSG